MPHDRCTVPGCRDTLRRVTLVEWDGVSCPFHLVCATRAHRTKGYAEQYFLCCPHHTLAEQLVRRGYFPSSPDLPTYAFSIKLLDFYYHLWFQSADSAMAAAAALHGFHADMGFVLKNSKGQMIDEGYRRPLQYAIQWYDILRNQLDGKVEDLVSAKRRWSDAWSEHDSQRTTAAGSATSPTPPVPDARTRCSEYLIECCGMCFDDVHFGRGVDEGCDIHVGGDANFSQRHNFVAGDCPPFRYQGVYQLSPERVAAMETKLEEAGKRPRGQYKGGVPNEDLDACQDSHTAGTSSKEKVKSDRFDDKGVFALICRHGIPLCFMNVTDPGEGQKYMLAGLEWLAEQLPPRATVAGYYDVGCITDRTRQLYDVLPAGFSDRLVFVTSAMHSYAHQWTCQIIYSPRMKKGMGLTDGEGVERLWSALRMLIPKLRAVSRRRRLVLLDRQLQRLGRRMRQNLGKWMRRRRKAIQDKSEKAAAQLVKSGHTRRYLSKQWEEQRRAELSVRSHPTNRLRKSLDAVLNLQEQADALDESIKAAEKSISGSSREATTAANRCIRKLRSSQADLLAEAQSLYATLHIDQEFEEIRGLGLEFTAVLLQAHEAKRTCRLLLQRRFQEWKTLDSAHGGQGLPVGTSIHTRTVAAMKKRTPTIQRALKAYNDLCERLRSLRPVGSDFPLPQPLSTELKHLKNNDQLMQDVYIASNEGPAPAWLVDETVRSGIRAMLVLERCAEEGLRLDREARNLMRWHRREAAAVAAACDDPSSTPSAALYQPDFAFVQLTPPATPPHRRRVRFADDPDIRTFVAECDYSEPEDDTDEDNDELEEMAIPKSPSRRRRDAFLDDAIVISSDEDSASDSDSDEGEVADDDSDIEMTQGPRHAPAVTIPPAPKDSLDLLPNIDIEPASWLRLVSQRRWLNDECVTTGLSALAREYPLRLDTFCALSSFELTCWMDKMGIESLYRHVESIAPWTRDAVIVPVNEGNVHWVLAVVWPKCGVVEIFDSLARSQRPYHAQMVYQYMHAITEYARRRDPSIAPLPSAWVARPMVSDAQQSNLSDCGVWILCTAAALLEGKRITARGEADIPLVRAALATLIRKHCMQVPDT
ncbi:hypothetical protein AURDEDRAFT_74267 [Auricularia subglabra TFB-10046 SS5]|uniref:Ubiquitin-like protease family profile domain-containing protein n=1 Tax=Auricularia subglabra (strain TFB-10046 / SS5) TaxID=717982 RepID=J0LG11_AURST|nr:hypothetical protein AURDEDRAFT_74267 [Auricularia subglabra TFB-10046 SS5]